MPRLRRLFLFFVLSTCVVAPASGIAQVQADTLTPPVATDTNAARVDSSSRAPVTDTVNAPTPIDTVPIRDTVSSAPRDSSQVLGVDTTQAVVRDTAQTPRDTVEVAPVVPVDTTLVEFMVKASRSEMVTRAPPPKARLVRDGSLP